MNKDRSKILFLSAKETGIFPPEVTAEEATEYGKLKKGYGSDIINGEKKYFNISEYTDEDFENAVFSTLVNIQKENNELKFHLRAIESNTDTIRRIIVITFVCSIIAGIISLISFLVHLA